MSRFQLLFNFGTLRGHDYNLPYGPWGVREVRNFKWDTGRNDVGCLVAPDVNPELEQNR